MIHLARVIAVEQGGVWVTLVLDTPTVTSKALVGADAIEKSPGGANGCGSCAAKAGCGNGLISQLMEKKSRLWVPFQKPENQAGNPPRDDDHCQSPALGSLVRISLNENHRLLGAFLMFGSPLVGLLLGLLVSAFFSFLCPSRFQEISCSQDIMAILGILFGFFMAYLALRYFSSSPSLQRKLQLRLV